MTKQIDDGGTAFPMHERDDALQGMTLLDWYVGQALQGVAFSDWYLAEEKVAFAYKIARLVIAEKRRLENE